MNLAERLLRQAVAGLRGVLGNEDPVTLSAVNDLGNVLANRRKSDEAAKCYQECLDIHDRFLKTIGEKKLDEEIARDRDSPEHNRPWQALSGRMTALIGLGSVACDRHNLEEAERLLRSATSDALRLLGPNHPETAAAYDWLSNALFTQRRCREAAEARDRAYQITDAVLGSDHHTTVNNLMMLVIYRFVSGDLAGATASFRRLRETCMKCTRTELIGFAGITGQLATSLASRGLLPEACEYFKIEYEMRLRCHQTRDPATPAALNNLLALTRMLGDEDEVKKLEGEQIALLEEAEGRDAPATISAINDLAKRLESLDAFEEAEVQYRKAIEHAPNAIVVLGNYAFFRQNFRRDMAGARELYLQALRADPDDSINHTNFAGLCLVTNQMAEAESHLRDAWRLTGGKADGYTWRTLFLRAALAALRNESVTLYLGQLRTLVDAGIRPVPSRNLAVRERLRQGLSGAVAVLLDAVYQAITESRGVAGLAERSDWQAIRPVPLDSPWPG